MHDHPLSGHHRHRWTFRSALHILGAIGEFWSSDLNRAAVDLIDPQPGMTLLDVGAGLGPATIEAAHRIGPNGKVIAVDPSPIMRGALRLRRLWQRTRRLIDVRAERRATPISSARSMRHGRSTPPTTSTTSKRHGGARQSPHTRRTDTAHRRGLHQPQPPLHRHHGDTDGPEPVDATPSSTCSPRRAHRHPHEHQPIAGVTATIITATAPANHPTSAGARIIHTQRAS